MEKRNLLLFRTVWIFSLFLPLLPLSAKATEMRWFCRYTAMFTSSRSSGTLARILPGRHATAIRAQNVDGSPSGRGEVILAFPAPSERTGSLIDTDYRKPLASRSSPRNSEAIRHSRSLSDTGAALVHFELTDSLIYMQASVNGSRPLWMILDTGASVTVFDESVSKMLGIQFLGQGNAYGPGQGSSQKLAFANHATLMFAGEELGDQTVAALPLEWFSREVGRSTDGFLGSNVFRNYVVEIDYANQVLRFHDPAAYSYSGSGQRFPLRFIWNDIPTVRAEVVAQDGTAITAVFLVDSGATTAIWLTKAFSEAHPEVLSAQDTVEVPKVVAVGGQLSARLGRVQAIRLGGFEVPMPLTQFPQNTSGIFAAPNIMGVIGAQMLRRFTVIFDYPHRQMILEPNEHFGDQSE
jgi:Aspartyl protease